MRDILFRGQTRRLGEKVYMNGEKVPSNWVYGGVCQGKGSFSIIYGSMDMELEQPTEKRVVYTDTLGQYTGLTDKNGKKIFEGDIIKVTDDNGETNLCSCGVGYVCFYDGVWYIADEVNDGLYDVNKIYYVEVIGNIHDNPELLEKGE